MREGETREVFPFRERASVFTANFPRHFVSAAVQLNATWDAKWKGSEEGRKEGNEPATTDRGR